MRNRDPLEFYRKTITPEYVESLLRASELCPRAGIYTAVVVLWLMISQRLSPKKSLADAVELLRIRRERELLELSTTSGRARRKKVSPNTGGYAQARKRIPLEVVESVSDRLNQAVLEECVALSKSKREVFIIDGSTLMVSYTPDNLSEYPQQENQHGKSHYPLLRICVATHAETGVVLRPTFGPFNGPHAVGELTLAEELCARLPKGATVVSDRLFGCFRYLHKAVSRELQVVCRMKTINATSVLGFEPKGVGERKVVWTPSPVEEKKYPQLSQAKLRGKFVWCPLRAKGNKKEMLILFTSLDLSIEEIVDCYGKRWLVELDLRDLKSTLKMNFIDARTPQMIAKEILLGATAYNLIRLMISSAAIAAKKKAREFSFTAAIRRTHSVASAFFLRLADKHLDEVLDSALIDLRGILLPARAGPRQSEPRRVWSRGNIHYFKNENSRQTERKNAPKRRKPVLGE